MKKMVRLISVVMVIVMMFSMATSAFADRVAATGGGVTVHTGASIVGGGSVNGGSNGGASISANTRPTHYTAPDGSVKTTTDLTVNGTAEAPKYLGNGDIDYEDLINSDDENIANNADFIMYVHDHLDELDEGTKATGYAIFGEEVIEGAAFEKDEDEESDCKHEWIEATCTAPKTCSKCQATEGAALPHDFHENEDASITCSVCGIAYCVANDHSWNNNGDGTQTCNVCGEKMGEHVHSYSNATCTEPETCSCGDVRGDALGHSYINGVCARCGAAAPIENNGENTSGTEGDNSGNGGDNPGNGGDNSGNGGDNSGNEGNELQNPENEVINGESVAYVGKAKQKVIHAEAIAYSDAHTPASSTFSEVCPGHSSLISSLGANQLTFNKAFDICNSTDYRITINMKGTEIVAPTGEYAFVIKQGPEKASSITFTNGSISGNGFWVEDKGVLNLGGLVNNKVDILVHNGTNAVRVESGGTAVIGQGTQLKSTGGNIDTVYGATVYIMPGGQARMSGGLVELVSDTESTHFAVLNQGTFLLNASGYDMNDSNGVVKNANGVAILTSGGANTTIGAGSVIGQTGIAIQGKSNLLMYNGTVTGTGTHGLSWPNTGSAIVAFSPENNEPIVTVSGGALRSEKSAAIINLTANGTRKDKGETTNITLFSEGIITQQAAGMYSDFRVAKFTVNDIGYASLADAIRAANTNANNDPTVTIKMGGNYEMTAADTVALQAKADSSIIFDGNGYTLDVPDGINGLTVDGGNVTIKNVEIAGTYGNNYRGVLVTSGSVTIGGSVTINKFKYGIVNGGGSVYINDVYLPESVGTGIYCFGVSTTNIAMVTDDCDIPIQVEAGTLNITGGWFKRDDIKPGKSPDKPGNGTKVSAYIDPSQSHLKWIEADKYYEVLYNDEPTVTLISPTTATVSGDKTYIEYDKNIYEANAEPLIFEFDAGCVQVDAVSYNAAKTVYPIFTCTTTDSKGNLVGATGKVRVADLSVLKDLPAGAYDLVFKFANGAKITEKLVLKVYPAVFMAFKVPNSAAMSNLEAAAVKANVIDDNRLHKTGYNVDDEENILVLMSELPEKVAVGSHSYPYGEDVNQKTYMEYYINGIQNGDGTCIKIPSESTYGTYAPGNYAFFISYADLNNLVPGRNFVFADYGDTLYQIEKSTDEYASVMEEFNMENDDVFITPTTVKWSTLSGMAYFTVKPDILNSDSANCASVYIDGECVPKQYWTYDKDTNSLGFKTEYLKQLPKEAHSLEIITSNGKVGATIETNVGLAPKNLDYHVYGGAKSLSFVASDKINKEGGVWIGSANPVKLDPSCYVWDSDTGFTLSSAFLNRLNLGTYYISAYVWDGSQYVYRTTSFKVISASQASYNPSTGDSSKIFIWIIVLVLSAVAIVVILLPRFKKGDGKEDTKAAGKKQKK